MANSLYWYRRRCRNLGPNALHHSHQLAKQPRKNTQDQESETNAASTKTSLPKLDHQDIRIKQSTYRARTKHSPSRLTEMNTISGGLQETRKFYASASDSLWYLLQFINENT
jgi:hypothetical protein